MTWQELWYSIPEKWRDSNVALLVASETEFYSVNRMAFASEEECNGASGILDSGHPFLIH